MTRERFGRHVPPDARRPVAWYAPIGLRTIAQQQLWSTNLLRNLDRRETFRGPLELTDLTGLAEGADSSFWFDFLADTGDGGSATYTVARGVLSAELSAEDAPSPLPEGRLLILGGDLAYPGASPELYQSRLVEMFELARDPASRYRDAPKHLAHEAPWGPDHKLVAAIPQNHDWFDSASTFCRYFVNDEKAGLIGARAPQRRTYFAFALPHDWIVLGFDFALTGDLDRTQFEAFNALIENGSIAPGSHAVLIYPEPYWTRPLKQEEREAYPLRYQRLEHLLAQRGVHVRLRLAGDLHHYSRERLDSAPPSGFSTDVVTCGCGGAFGHATHSREVLEPKVLQWASEPGAAQEELQGRVVLGRLPDLKTAEAVGLCFRPTQGERAGRAQARCYPDIDTSRRQAWGNVLALLRPRGEPWHRSNLAFSAMVGALLLVAGLTPGDTGPWLLRVLSSPWSMAAHAGLATTALFLTTDNDPVRAGWGDRLWGTALLGGLMALAWGLRVGIGYPALQMCWPNVSAEAPRWSGLAAAWLAEPLVTLGRGLALATVGLTLATVLSGGVVGTFMALLSRFTGRASNNTSSALSLQGHKGFLRFKVGPEGIEAFMVGTDEVPRRWAPQPGSTHRTRPYWSPAEGESPPRWRVIDRFFMRR